MSQKKVRENALLSFETFCGFLDNCVSASGPAARMKHLKTFLETYLNREANVPQSRLLALAGQPS